MGRDIKGPAPGQRVKYIPAVDGNEDEAEGEAVIVWITNPTRADVRSWLRDNRSTRFEFDAEGKSGAMVTDPDSEMWKKNALVRFVPEIEHYKCNGVEIVNGELLWLHGETDFVDAIAFRVKSALSLQKKPPTPSSVPSDSQPVATAPSNGTATNAA